MIEVIHIKSLINKIIPSYISNKFSGQVNLQKIISNTGWLLVERVLRMGVSLFVIVWLARYLGPQKFGLLSFAQAYVVMFSFLTTLGMDTILVKKIVSSKSQSHIFLGTAFTLRIIGAFVLLFTTVITSMIFLDNDTSSIIAIIALGWVFQSPFVIDFWFQAKVQSKYVVFSRSFAFLITTLLKVLFIIWELELIYFAILISFEFVLTSIFLIYYFKRLSGYLTWSFDLKVAKNILQESFPLILSSLVTIIYMKTDQIMLGFFGSETEVGIYSAAVRLTEGFYFVPVAISSTLYPFLIKAKSTPEYKQKVQKMYNYIINISLFIALIVSAFAPVIIKYTYGPEYSESAIVLMILSWALIFTSMLVSRSKWLLVEGKQIIIFYSQLSGAIINILLNVIFIPLYGVIGAAIATLISYSFAGYFSGIIIPYLRKDFINLTKAFFFIPIYILSITIKKR